jgi:hypothetical protein
MMIRHVSMFDVLSGYMYFCFIKNKNSYLSSGLGPNFCWKRLAVFLGSKSVYAHQSMVMFQLYWRVLFLKIGKKNPARCCL